MSTSRDSLPLTSDGWQPRRREAEPAQEGVVQKAWRIVRRHPLLILQAVLITAAAAFLYSSTREKTYTATASVLFSDNTDSILGNQYTGAVDPSRVAATNEQLLSLPVVAAGASKRLGGNPTPGEIGAAISIVSSEQADIVDIQAATNDPRLSVRVANAYGAAFKEFRQKSARAEIQAAISQARLAQTRLTATERRGDRGDSLRDRIARLEEAASLQTGGAELVQTAPLPSEPSAPKPVRSGIAGGLLGLLIGFSLAALRERTDQRLRTAEEVAAAYGQPLLARLPPSRILARGQALPERSEEAEALRMIRASLRYLSVDVEFRSLLVTSATPGEGKSTTARNLALTMASMGDHVILVEADLHGKPGVRRPSIEGPGLSGVLVGDHLDDALYEVPVEAAGGEDRVLTVLPGGPPPPNPSELLESQRMRDLLQDLQERYDVVVVDSPPLAILSDAFTLVRHVSGIIVVGAVGKTTRAAVRDFRQRIELLGGDMVGVVANFAPNEHVTGSYYTSRS